MNLLFVTKGAFGSNDATGAMLNNVFEGFPNLQILQYSITPLDKEHITPISNVTFVPNINYSLFSVAVSWFDKKLEKRKFPKIWKVLKSISSYLDSLIPPIISGKEFSFMESFKPDIIYTLGANIKVLRIARTIAKRFDKPVVIHNMDDFYNMNLHSPIFYKRLYTVLLRKEYELTYSHSFKSLAIGPKMAEEYSEKFGMPFDWVMNCVSSEKQKPIRPLKENISLVIFSGGLHGGRSKSLALIADSIEQNSGVRLEIFTGKQDKKAYNTIFADFKNTTLLEYVEKDRMFDNLSRADILLHVESFEPEHMTYFRLSMSTKIPEYMSVARPILCVGPQNLSTVEFIETYKIGHVIHNVNKIGKALLELADINYRSTLVNNALTVLGKEFKQSFMQEKLRNVFEYNINCQINFSERN